MLVMRNKNGVAMVMISRNMARQLITRYLGEWSENKKGESIYTFRETAVYGNNEIGMMVFPGSYINVEDHH